ncbi:HTH-type transcriptional repressor RspR [anaerobic digester metagenome]|uniref:GntR family transcriptional regulator n=1 Tax=Oscillibacter ruminantium TaxID=1263547 RepID=UPI0033165E86
MQNKKTADFERGTAPQKMEKERKVMLEKQLPYKHRVYDALKKEILSGHYKPGDVLNERKLSEDLGISRTPVREALQMLEQDGWLQIETYKGAVVREFDWRYMQETARIRSALEACAIEDAAEHITESDLALLEQIQEEQQKMLENFDVEAFIVQDRRFHTCLYERSGNHQLIRLLENYYDIFRFLGTQAVMNSEERRLTTLLEHQAILDALKRRDTAGAVEAMKAHMHYTEENMRSHRVSALAEGQEAPAKV